MFRHDPFTVSVCVHIPRCPAASATVARLKYVVPAVAFEGTCTVYCTCLPGPGEGCRWAYCHCTVPPLKLPHTLQSSGKPLGCAEPGWKISPLGTRSEITTPSLLRSPVFATSTV